MSDTKRQNVHIPTNANVAGAIKKLQPSEKAALELAAESAYWYMWNKRGRRSPGMSVATMITVLAKAGAAME